MAQKEIVQTQTERHVEGADTVVLLIHGIIEGPAQFFIDDVCRPHATIRNDDVRVSARRPENVPALVRSGVHREDFQIQVEILQDILCAIVVPYRSKARRAKHNRRGRDWLFLSEGRESAASGQHCDCQRQSKDPLHHGLFPSFPI